MCCVHSSYVWLSLGVVKRQSCMWLSPAAIRWRLVPCCHFVCLHAIVLRTSLRVLTKLSVAMNFMWTCGCSVHHFYEYGFEILLQSL